MHKADKHTGHKQSLMERTIKKKCLKGFTEGDFKKRLKNTDLKETETLLDNCVKCL